MADRRVLTGPRAVVEALRSPRSARTIHVVYLGPNLGRKDAERLRAEADRAGVRAEPAPDRRTLDRLAGELRHQGVVALAGAYDFLSLDELLDVPPIRADRGRLLLALDQVTDPHNFGAILRSAVALGVDGVVVTKDRAAPVSGAVVRASAGATEHARIARVTNLARSLRELQDPGGLDVVGLDAEAETPLHRVPPPPAAGRVLVVGSEGRGLRRLVREACDVLAGIPLAGPVASLNASVAASLGVYELTRGDASAAGASS